MILMGSRACQLRAGNILQRKCVDFDFLCTMDEYHDWLENNSNKISPTKIYPIEGKNKMIVEGSTNCEFEIIMPGTSSELLNNIVKCSPDTINTPFGMVPNLDMLFTIKTSHRYLKNSPHFWKTLFDWHRMKAAGARVRPEYEDFLALREKETYAAQKHPKLNVDKKNFFSEDGVNYKYDHDSLHRAIMLQEHPAYTYYMKDGSEVFSDKNKFFECSHEIRLAGALEECSTLALERSKVPYGSTWSDSYAWHFAFSKVCSSITSGFFRKWCFENALEIISLYPYIKYVERFQYGLNNGIVKPFGGSKY